MRVVAEDVERAKAVFGRLLLIRSVGELRVFCGPGMVRGVFPTWTYIPVASFFVRCRYRKQIAVLSEEDRAIARERSERRLAANPHSVCPAGAVSGTLASLVCTRGVGDS